MSRSPATLDSWIEYRYVRIGSALAGAEPRTDAAIALSLAPNDSHRTRGAVVKLVPAVFVLSIVGCRARPSPPLPENCGPTVPETAQHPMALPATALAGDYQLVQVRTQPSPGSVRRGRLHFMPVDSASRAASVGGAVRDLIGWFDPMDGDNLSQVQAASRDPEHPGAVLAGSHLRLGQAGSLNAYVDHLTITAVSRDGFWGWWKEEPGLDVAVDRNTGRRLPDPAGFFCALRVRT